MDPRKKITSVIHTGQNVLNTKSLTAKEIVSRRSEPFPRISGGSFLRLVSESVVPQADESIASVRGVEPAGLSPRLVVVDAGDVGGSAAADRKLLIIDARRAEEHELVRVRDSISFPLLKLRQDRGMPYALLAARHAADKVVVCCDWEEGPGSEAVELVTKLVATGWANAVLLTGGIKGLLHLRPELFEGSAAEHAVSSALAEAAAAETLLPGEGPDSTLRRGSVRPDGSFGSFRSGGALRGSGGSVVSGMGDSRRGTPLTRYSGPRSVAGGGGGRAGASGFSPGSRAPSISSRMTTGAASTIGGAPMRLLAGGSAAGAAAPGQSFSHSPRF